jgi:hypothetical protein
MQFTAKARRTAKIFALLCEPLRLRGKMHFNSYFIIHNFYDDLYAISYCDLTCGPRNTRA